MHLILLFLIAAMSVFVITPTYAQDPNDTVSYEEKLPREVKEDDHAFWTVSMENDLFGSGSDKYYTKGIRLSYFNRASKNKDVKEFIDQYIPYVSPDDTTSVYYSIGQNLYTPKDITKTTFTPNDRPYAGFLYGSVGLSTIKGDHIDEFEVSLGVVGPAALGKQTQKLVHKLVNSPDPKGWDHQLENEPGLILSYQRVWPEAWAYDELQPFYFRLMPHAGVSLGNIYTHASFGGTLQITPLTNAWQNPPLRIRPAIPGDSFFGTPDGEFTWSFFLGAEERIVGRNIFLDGNTFENSPSVDKNYLVTDLNAGVTTGYGDVQLAYTLNWRSKEFKTQDEAALFGAVSLSIRY